MMYTFLLEGDDEAIEKIWAMTERKVLFLC